MLLMTKEERLLEAIEKDGYRGFLRESQELLKEEGFYKKLFEDIDISEIHDCEKCHGKLVGITVDLVGIERCGYCGQVVPYKEFILTKIKEKLKNGLPKR